MINLITGATGSGKSAYCMSELLDKIEEGRPLFVHGIPDLKIPHTLVVCENPLCEVCPPSPIAPIEPQAPDYDAQDCELRQYAIELDNYKILFSSYSINQSIYDQNLKAVDWHIWAPDGALIIYDEVHYVYEPVSSSAKKKPSVTLFTTHRHRGLDFYLMTQSPLLFDKSVRLLVGKHIHLNSTWAGRYQYEYTSCNDATRSTYGAVKSKYVLNKKVFGLYKSSSLHTKQNKKTPVVFYLLFFFAFLFVGITYKLKSRLTKEQPLQNIELSELDQIDENIEKELTEDLDERILNHFIVASWASNGIPQEDFSIVPSMCTFRNKVIVCPPYSIGSELVPKKSVDRLCIGEFSCTYYFKIQETNQFKYS